MEAVDGSPRSRRHSCRRSPPAGTRQVKMAKRREAKEPRAKARATNLGQTTMQTSPAEATERREQARGQNPNSPPIRHFQNSPRCAATPLLNQTGEQKAHKVCEIRSNPLKSAQTRSNPAKTTQTPRRRPPRPVLPPSPLKATCHPATRRRSQTTPHSRAITRICPLSWERTFA